jgi:excisionase family DNA binding protein
VWCYRFGPLLAASGVEAMTESELLTIEEFAKALRVKPSCVRRWITEQKITICHIGRLVRIPRREVDRLIEQGMRPARVRVIE